ncbi:hypothetical protein ACQJBY_069631 [Aegilops geniculata]
MILHISMATSLFLMSLLMLLLDSNPCTALSWRNNSLVDDVGIPCPVSPHPFTMCKSEAEAYGYPCEDHKVTTEDGYILSLKRIPHGHDTDNSTGDEKTRQPILLFHGLFVTVGLMFG